MTNNLKLYRFGQASTDEDRSALPSGIDSTAVATPLSQAASGELNRLAADSDSDWIAFADAGLSPAPNDLSKLLAACADADAASAVVLPTSPLPEMRRCWEQLPPRFAALLAPPEPHLLIALRTAHVDAAGGFHEVDAPVWDLLIRLSETNESVAVVPCGSRVDLQDGGELLDLPSLNPHDGTASPAWLRNHLLQLDIAAVVSKSANRHDPVALKSGVLLLHDELEESHNLSQTVQGEGAHQAGDYWHGILHRREPDYSNAKYWFRRVGRHPVFDAVAECAARILSRCESAAAVDWAKQLQAANGWDPFAFVDLCEQCGGSRDNALIRAAEEIQFAEMLLLIQQTYRDAAAD